MCHVQECYLLCPCHCCTTMSNTGRLYPTQGQQVVEPRGARMAKAHGEGYMGALNPSAIV